MIGEYGVGDGLHERNMSGTCFWTSFIFCFGPSGARTLWKPRSMCAAGGWGDAGAPRWRRRVLGTRALPGGLPLPARGGAGSGGGGAPWLPREPTGLSASAWACSGGCATRSARWPNGKCSWRKPIAPRGRDSAERAGWWACCPSCPATSSTACGGGRGGAGTAACPCCCRWGGARLLAGGAERRT